MYQPIMALVGVRQAQHQHRDMRTDMLRFQAQDNTVQV